MLDADGRIDVLVNNAGIYPALPVRGADLRRLASRARRRTSTASTSARTPSIPSMRERGYGRIVNVSSATFFIGYPGADRLRRQQGRHHRLHTRARERGRPARHHRQRGHAGARSPPRACSSGEEAGLFDEIVPEQAVATPRRARGHRRVHRLPRQPGRRLHHGAGGQRRRRPPLPLTKEERGREQHTSRPLSRRRALDGRPRGRRAQAHRAKPGHRRGRDPRGHVRDRDQHAGAGDRPRRGRAHGFHRRGVRRPPRHRRPRPLHRRTRRGDRAALRARPPLRRLPDGSVQGPLARGDRGPLLQHALRDLARGRGRPPRGEEPPLVPRALLHPARRLRPLGRALRRRDRRLLPGPAHRRTSATSGRSAARTASTRRPSARSP